MKFNKMYNLLFEFKYIDYKIPVTDKKQLLYDFYCLSYLKYLNMEPGFETSEQQHELNPEQLEKVYKKGGKTSHFASFRDNVDIAETVYDAFNKVVPWMYSDILESLFFSLACEVRHIYDTVSFGGSSSSKKDNMAAVFAKEGYGEVFKAYDTIYEEFQKNSKSDSYIKSLSNQEVLETLKLTSSSDNRKNSYCALRKLMAMKPVKIQVEKEVEYTPDTIDIKASDDGETIRSRKYVKPTEEDATIDVSKKEKKKMKYNTEQITLDPEKVIAWMQFLFWKLPWSSSYGGKAWGKIVDGWKDLYLVGNKEKVSADSKNLEKILFAIDHMIDICHNTNIALDKVPGWSSNDGYGWIKKALNYRRYANVQELATKCSPQMKQIITATVGITAGVGIKDLEVRKDDYMFAMGDEWEKKKEKAAMREEDKKSKSKSKSKSEYKSSKSTSSYSSAQKPEKKVVDYLKENKMFEIFNQFTTENIIIQSVADKEFVKSYKDSNGLNMLLVAIVKTVSVSVSTDKKLIDLIHKLVEEVGIDVNACNNNNDTALHYAAGVAKNLDLVKYLVEKGADPNAAASDDGMKALNYAEQSGMSDIVEYLKPLTK